MLLSFINKFQLYIIGVLVALLLMTSVGFVLERNKQRASTAQAELAMTKLDVSNKSIVDLKVALADIEANVLKQQEVDRKKQLEVSEALKGAAVKEKELAKIRGQLTAVTKVVKPTETIPGDIQDAWKGL